MQEASLLTYKVIASFKKQIDHCSSIERAFYRVGFSSGMASLNAAAHEGCALIHPTMSSRCNANYRYSSIRTMGYPLCNVQKSRGQRACPRRQRYTRHLPCASGSSDDSVSTSAFNEVAALDKLIDVLRGANGQQELTQLVAENLLAFDQKFWIRLATRADAAQSSEEKDALKNLANVRAILTLCLCRKAESSCQTRFQFGA